MFFLGFVALFLFVFSYFCTRFSVVFQPALTLYRFVVPCFSTGQYGFIICFCRRLLLIFSCGCCSCWFLKYGCINCNPCCKYKTRRQRARIWMINAIMSHFTQSCNSGFSVSKLFHMPIVSKFNTIQSTGYSSFLYSVLLLLTREIFVSFFCSSFLVLAILSESNSFALTLHTLFLCVFYCTSEIMG